MSQVQHVAATVSNVSGVVIVDRHGQSVELKNGDSVYATDTIKTDSGAVEITFLDGAKAMLGPNSVMAVQEFSMGSAEEDASFVLNLASGALRTISGAVVEQNPDAFKIITPKATAGIRGTDFSSHVLTDGSERFVLISLDQGHNLVVTTHTGQQVSLTSAYEGVDIDKDDASLVPVKYSEKEIAEIVQQIMSALQGEESEDSTSTDQVTLLLDSATAQALNDANLLDDLVTSATQAGASVSIEDGEDFLEPPTVTGLLASDSTEGGSSSLISVSISGAVSYFADATVTGAGNTYFMASQHIVVENPITKAGVIISGDVENIDGGTVTAGNDSITIPSMSDGTVVGDAAFMGMGTLYAGNDTITLAGDKTGGNSIYGDVQETSLDSGAVYFGHDSIVVQGNFSNSTIAGDSASITESFVQQWGNDTIRIEGNIKAETSAVHIYGDASGNSNGGGNDSIYIGGNVEWANNISTIDGGGGDDIIKIDGNFHGHLYGGAGNDFIRIAGDAGTAISGDDGHDTIIIEGDFQSSSSIIGGVGNDFIRTTLGDSHGSQGVSGGEGNDTIHVHLIMNNIVADSDTFVVMSEDGATSSYKDELYLTKKSSLATAGVRVVDFDFDNDTLFVNDKEVIIDDDSISNKQMTVDGITIYFTIT